VDADRPVQLNQSLLTNKTRTTRSLPKMRTRLCRYIAEGIPSGHSILSIKAVRSCTTACQGEPDGKSQRAAIFGVMKQPLSTATRKTPTFVVAKQTHTQLSPFPLLAAIVSASESVAQQKINADWWQQILWWLSGTKMEAFDCSTLRRTLRMASRRHI
jgi:hypothetical protein